MSLWKVSVPYAGILTYRDIEAASEEEAIEYVQLHSVELTVDEDEGSDPGAPCWAEPERTRGELVPAREPEGISNV